MLIEVLVKNVNFEKNGNWEKPVRKSKWKQKEILRKLFIRPNVKLREIDLSV